MLRLPIIFGLSLAVVAVPGFGQQNVGFVLELQGKWVSGKDQAPLKLAQSVQGGLVLENRDPTDGDHIVVANLQGEIIKTIRCKSGACRECAPAGGCYDPIHPLPNPEETPSNISTVMNAVVELLSAKPDRYSIHRVRGAEGFRSSVAELEGDGIDLNSLLEGVEPGDYEFQFISLSERAGPSKLALSGQARWKPGERMTLSLNGIEPGLYEVHYRHGTTSGNVWLLLCPTPEFGVMVTAFQRFTHQTQSWDKNVTPNTRQAYQRAYLEYLSLQTVRSAR
jgi:hypothetical protein